MAEIIETPRGRMNRLIRQAQRDDAAFAVQAIVDLLIHKGIIGMDEFCDATANRLEDQQK